MNAILAWIFQELLKFLYGVSKEQFEAMMREQQAKGADKVKTDQAVADIQKPLDPNKTKEQRDKDEEDAFDRFHDRLS